MTPKTIYEAETVGATYRATKESNGEDIKIVLKEIRKKVLVSGMFRPFKEKTFYEIKTTKNNITFCNPIFGLRWPVFSCNKDKAFIEISRQSNPTEELEYNSGVKKYLQSSSSNRTVAWLNLHGKRLSLAYYGMDIPFVEKKFLDLLSKEVGIQIRELK